MSVSETTTLNSTYGTLTRHYSFIKKPKATQLDEWLEEQHSRCLSVPDLSKLSREWDSYQKSDETPDNRVIDSKLQAIAFFFFLSLNKNGYLTLLIGRFIEYSNGNKD